MLFGVILIAYSAYLLITSNVSVNLIWAWLMWIQFMMLSVIADYVGKTYLESKHRPNYIITKSIESSMKVNK